LEAQIAALRAEFEIEQEEFMKIIAQEQLREDMALREEGKMAGIRQADTVATAPEARPRSRSKAAKGNGKGRMK
ncbi:MAG TPA: hypothetical protein VFQ92_16615, partial [Blastocatellia bacterium]|nr:hypothetical protein [Blastocatellia bacterium]